MTARLQSALLEELWWVERRAGRLADRYSGSRAEDIVQEVVTEFLERTRDGWFDQAPRQSLEAQIRHLLRLCLMHQTTRLNRDQARAGSLPAREDDPSEPFEWVPDPGADRDAEGRIVAIRRLRDLEALTPPQRLFLFALDSPGVVTEDDVRRAADFVAGGGSAVLRDAGEAWRMFDGLRRRRRCFVDRDWKTEVARVFRWSGPTDELQGEELARARNAIEAHRSRAAKHLLAKWAQEGEV